MAVPHRVLLAILGAILLIAGDSPGAEPLDPLVQAAERKIKDAALAPSPNAFRETEYEVMRVAGRDPSYRRERMRLSLLLRKAMVAACDPKFDREKRIPTNYEPPASEYAPGIEHPSFEDPAVIAGYLKAKRKYDTYVESSDRERALRKEIRTLDAFVNICVERDYGKTEAEHEALVADLKEYREFQDSTREITGY